MWSRDVPSLPAPSEAAAEFSPSPPPRMLGQKHDSAVEIGAWRLQMNRAIEVDVYPVCSLMSGVVDNETVAGADHSEPVRMGQVLLRQDHRRLSVGDHHPSQENHPVGRHRLAQIMGGHNDSLPATDIFGEARFDRC